MQDQPLQLPPDVVCMVQLARAKLHALSGNSSAAQAEVSQVLGAHPRCEAALLKQAEVALLDGRLHSCSQQLLRLLQVRIKTSDILQGGYHHVSRVGRHSRLPPVCQTCWLRSSLGVFTIKMEGSQPYFCYTMKEAGSHSRVCATALKLAGDTVWSAGRTQ